MIPEGAGRFLAVRDRYFDNIYKYIRSKTLVDTHKVFKKTLMYALPKYYRTYK